VRGGVPAWVRPCERAIEKQADARAGDELSGLVTRIRLLGASGQDTGNSPIPDEAKRDNALP